jgi:protein gp37
MLTGELAVDYGRGRTIFVDHCNDLFAEAVPADWIMRVLDHCAKWTDNIYVYQTKNPGRFADFIAHTLPTCILGCTIETNRDIPAEISVAPRPVARASAMKQLSGTRRLFVTVEPVMDFDVPVLGQWLTEIRPEFVNIGADSKRHRLPEPTVAKVLALIDVLNAAGIEIREKHNLGRILGTPNERSEGSDER